jgi:hypothetical protein
MGNEIVYCVRCRNRLLAAEFDRGKAAWHEDKPYCAACLRELADTLRPEDAQRLLEQLALKRAGDLAVPETPRRGTPRKTSTSRIPVVKTERRTVAPGSPSSMVPWLIAGAVVLLLGAGAAMMPRRTEPASRGSETTKTPAPPVEIPRGEALPPRPDTSADLQAARRDEAARKALDKARSYGKTNAADLPGRLAAFEEAAWECRGTSLAAEARREHEALQKQRGDQVAAELAPLAEKARAAAAASHYGEAITLLQKERARLAGADWSSAVDQKILQIRESADRAFAPLKQKALQSRRLGDEKEAQAAADQVRSWGIDELAADLDAALAAVPPPARPPDPDVRAYLDAWEAAFGLARARDYATAIRDLEAAAVGLRDPAVKAEAAADLELLRLLGAAYADVVQSLTRAPKGQKVSIEVDAGGSPVRVDGAIVRQGAGSIDLKTDVETVTVDVDDLTPGSLRDILGKIPGRKPDADARIGALFPLLDGEAVDLSGPAGSLPPRIVSFGARVAQERARPDVSAKEGEARSRFGVAERQFGDPATRLQSFDTFRALVASYPDSAFVKRKKAVIAQRLDAEKEAGKEYVLYAEQMQASGAFRRTSQPKAASCWTNTVDVPAEKENYVEFSFAARAGVDYRCWVNVGACCQETFAFDAQGSEMGADPGSANRLPVKNTILFLKKTHVLHGGRKEPTRFEWVAVPLPKYATAGPKLVRLLSAQQGFSVALAVVSAVRSAAPSDAQVKEWERSRPAVASSTVAMTGAGDASLVGWWTLDEGSGTIAGDSSSNHLAGTLRGNPIWTSGKRRGGLSFDGQKDYVDVPKNPKLYVPGPFTVAAWVNVGTLPRSEWGMYLLSDYDAEGGRCTFALRVMSNATAQFFWQTETAEPVHAESTGRIAPGTWTHVAGVWDGTTRMLYVNGVLDGTSKGAQPRPDIGGATAIGRPGAANLLYFSGRLDDVRIYSRALSTAEIRALGGK